MIAGRRRQRRTTIETTPVAELAEPVAFDFAEIERDVTAMFTEIPRRLMSATHAFLDGDRDEARRVIESDKAIDSLQTDVEGLVQRELLRQPPEVELRYLVTVLRIVPELERTADLVEHIALRTHPALIDRLSPRARGQIAAMGEAATSMWQAAANAYLDRDPSASSALRSQDDVLDDLHVQLTNELANTTLEPSVAIELGLVARFFERLGDHAVNVVRRLEYLGAASP